jgi:hypothetical protein
VGKFEIKNGFTKDRWITEIRIPLEAVTPGRKSTEGTWGIAINRNWKEPWSQSSSPGGFTGRTTRVTFTESPGVAVSVEQLKDPFLRDIETHEPLDGPERDAPLDVGLVERAHAAERSGEHRRGSLDVGQRDGAMGQSLDPERMRQVLVNLLRNAVQASPDGGRVEARVASDRGELTFEVRDHGAGVPAAEASLMFEPFHTTRIHGTGLDHSSL